MLNSAATSAEPFITWVKEGRKYDLGALLITQQPGSIPMEILSQGDNWFIFHLLSSADLLNVRRANAHFSEDLLSALLNEPIPGQGIFWSSVGGKAYPVSVRALSFEKMHPMLDPYYCRPAARTFAAELRERYAHQLEEAAIAAGADVETNPEGRDEPADALAVYQRRTIEALRHDIDLMSRVRSQGVAWGTLKAFLKDHLPETLDNRDALAYRLVPQALNEILGPQGAAWHSERNAQGTTYVKAGRED